MSGLSGSLEAVGLRAIVGFLAGLGKSGTLRLAHDRWWGEVIIDRGEVVGAAFGAEQGLAALDAIALAFPVGTFNFVDAPPGSVPVAERNVDLPAPALLARLEETLGGRGASPALGFTLAAVPQVVLGDPGASAAPEKVALSRGAIQTLLAVDGRRSVADVAAGRGYAETIRDLQTLARQGLITLPVDLPERSAPETPTETPTPANGHRDAPAEVPAAPPAREPLVPEGRPSRDPAAAALAGLSTKPAAEWPVATEGVGPVAEWTAADEPSVPAAEPSAPVAEPARGTERGERGERGGHTCPKLGFAEDAQHHFSRPTQIHRCFAGTSPQRIATDDQQDFCLTGLFLACARFAAGATSLEAVPDSLRPGGAAAEVAEGPAGERAPVSEASAAQGPPQGPRQRPHLGPPGRATPSETGDGLLVAQAVNGVHASPPAAPTAPTLDGLDREALWAPAALVAPAAVEHAGAGGPSVVAVAPPLEADAPTQVMPFRVDSDGAGSDGPLSRSGRQGVADEPRPERSPGAPARPGRPGLLERLRGSRTQLLLVLVSAGIGAALLVPVLMRSADDDPRATPVAGIVGSTDVVGGSTPPAGGGTAPAGTPAGTPRAPRTVFDDRFVSSQSSWPNNPDSTAWFADGAYRLLARQPGQFVAIGAPLRERFRDVVVTGAFRKVGGPVGGGYGLIVRDQGPGARDGVNQLGAFYVFEVGDKGEVGIWRRDGDKWVDILPWAPSNAVSQGNTTNTLSVQAIGQQLTFSVNNQRVSSHTDGTLQEGSVGIFVGGDNNEVVIERFVVQLPG